ncbi:hypothetical protein MRX96_002895 [Rhipicephalus microplus]
MTHPDQKPLPSFKHNTKAALRSLPPHICRDPDRGPDRGLDPRPAIPGLPPPPEGGGSQSPKEPSGVCGTAGPVQVSWVDVASGAHAEAEAALQCRV